jgi:hypothetical protein
MYSAPFHRKGSFFHFFRSEQLRIENVYLVKLLLDWQSAPAPQIKDYWMKTKAQIL